MTLRSVDPDQPWTDYTVTSRQSGKTYRVSLRGLGARRIVLLLPRLSHESSGHLQTYPARPGESAQAISQKVLDQPYRRRNLSLRVDYGRQLGLRFNLPHRLDEEARQDPRHLYRDQTTDDVDEWSGVCGSWNGRPLGARLSRRRGVHRTAAVAGAAAASWPAEIRQDPAEHPLRRELLDAELLPYQLDGIAFAVGAGRAVLADDMGLGKTIQGIGVAELLARLADIRRVLVVCPASLKSQWRSEIHRFCDRSSQLVARLGRRTRRAVRKRHVLHDLQLRTGAARHPTIERVDWDLIILDEGQRIKNWESKTSQMVKSLRVALRPGAVRHAAGKPAGRTVLGRRSSSTTAGWARPFASSTDIAWSTTGARCWATRTSTSCARRCSRSCCGARAPP